ncbi:zinc finger BED domain-containing protein RICESLEEPER 2-like [Rosa chinensis]|uniref:zinc finger BED domain-containing protein RICESLEEPER 2-like n=1 Tax=Rosa chinensis TaxID=74649 RepID=UPI000D097DE9|nr:zinc finger BED domain-containing protein RICESLEEPER 2-like [Rosa chinensis]
MRMTTVAIRNAVRYVRSSASSQRLDFFKECVERVKLECKELVVLDVPTRWNSTFLRLERALKLQKAFDRMTEDDAEQSNSCLLDIASPMQDKFNKYWGSFEKLNPYLFIGIVLNPCHKLEKVVDYFEILDGEMDEKVEANTKRVKDLLYDLHKVYEEEGRENGVSEVSVTQASSEGVSSSIKGCTELERKLKEKEQRRRAKKAEIINNDVDRYLGDPIEGDGEDFDLLNWWRVNEVYKYLTLVRVAKEILAIPVSTIAWKSSFSTSGTIIDQYHSSLSPRMVEALICSQNWLRSENVYLHQVPTIEEMDCVKKQKENCLRCHVELQWGVVGVV